MSYEPKVGDRVTSPLLVGEWEVLNTDQLLPGYVVVRVWGESSEVMVHRGELSPVAPPLPPEPPVGSAVYVDGVAYMRSGRWWQSSSPPSREFFKWFEIAARSTPAVPLADVTEYLRSMTVHTIADQVDRKFGWSR